jgi:hypothetical protein
MPHHYTRLKALFIILKAAIENKRHQIWNLIPLIFSIS